MDLATVSPEEWDQLASLDFDAVWFMAVWERSPGLLADFKRALPAFAAVDDAGSPYCVRRCVVDEHLSGPQRLVAARSMHRKRGLRLILDFVPNHVAPDHPWSGDHPEYFVQGNADDARNDPVSFVEAGGTVFARGRDPYFPAWPDLLQLNAFQPGSRQAVIGTLCDIASQCDSMRCDMAMLLLNQIFERTWGSRAGQRPATEYWSDELPSVNFVIQSHSASTSDLSPWGLGFGRLPILSRAAIFGSDLGKEGRFARCTGRCLFWPWAAIQRGPGHPTPLLNRAYFNQVRSRWQDTGHIASFTEFQGTFFC